MHAQWRTMRLWMRRNAAPRIPLGIFRLTLHTWASTFRSPYQIYLISSWIVSTIPVNETSKIAGTGKSDAGDELATSTKSTLIRWPPADCFPFHGMPSRSAASRACEKASAYSDNLTSEACGLAQTAPAYSDASQKSACAPSSFGPDKALPVCWLHQYVGTQKCRSEIQQLWTNS